MPDHSRAKLWALGCAAWGVVALLTVSACSRGPCEPAGEGIQVGDRIKVRVVEHYDETSSVLWDPLVVGRGVRYTSCGRGFDFVEGSEVVFRLNGEQETDNPACLIRTASLEGVVPGFDEMGTTNMGIYAHPQPLFKSWAGVKAADGCEGGWYVAVRTLQGTTSAFARPTAGKLPPILLYREFATGNPELCQKPGGEFSGNRCFDYFVVELTKL